MKKAISLAAWIDGLHSSGRYTFSRDEASSALQLSKIAFKYALLRLVAKGRIAIARRGFYVIVPLEYKEAGALPAAWFIDDLMKFSGHPYYVGLLSAAALHGAAHQKPQEFQVMTDSPMRPARVGRNRIHFFLKSRMGTTPTSDVKTETGSMRVSTPEATALDLVRYSKRVGGLNHVVTVLSELSERIDPQTLIALAKQEDELSTVQRLGYLLEQTGSAKQAAKALARWITKKPTTLVALRPERLSKAVKKAHPWNLIINEKIESDL